MKNHSRFWVVFLVLMVTLAGCGKPTPSSVVNSFPTSLPPATAEQELMPKSMSSEQSSLDLTFHQDLTPEEVKALNDLPQVPSGCLGDIQSINHTSGVRAIRGSTFTKQLSVRVYSQQLDSRVYFYAAILNGKLFTDLGDLERNDRPFWAPSEVQLLPEGSLDDDTFHVSITATAPLEFKGEYVLVYTARTLDGDDCGERIAFAIEFI